MNLHSSFVVIFYPCNFYCPEHLLHVDFVIRQLVSVGIPYVGSSKRGLRKSWFNYQNLSGLLIGAT